jgi:hypothetical protein
MAWTAGRAGNSTRYVSHDSGIKIEIVRISIILRWSHLLWKLSFPARWRSRSCILKKTLHTCPLCKMTRYEWLHKLLEVTKILAGWKFGWQIIFHPSFVLLGHPKPALIVHSRTKVPDLWAIIIQSSSKTSSSSNWWDNKSEDASVSASFTASTDGNHPPDPPV